MSIIAMFCGYDVQGRPLYMLRGAEWFWPVTLRVLEELNITVPETPDFFTWKEDVIRRQLQSRVVQLP